MTEHKCFQKGILERNMEAIPYVCQVHISSCNKARTTCSISVKFCAVLYLISRHVILRSGLHPRGYIFSFCCQFLCRNYVTIAVKNISLNNAGINQSNLSNCLLMTLEMLYSEFLALLTCDSLVFNKLICSYQQS